MSTKEFPIPYSLEMLEAVRKLHAGAESLPGYSGWIVDHMGGRVTTFRQKLVPNIEAFVSLEGMSILDFGCGTGSSTVAIAERAKGCRIVGADLSEDALAIATRRLREHGLTDAVQLVRIPEIQVNGVAPFAEDSFDLIVLNGVLEHVVPFRSRQLLILTLWNLLKHGGAIFINETPNSVWPIDRHTTGLPFLPWLPSGIAYKLAVLTGRHSPGTDLDARGRRGMSYWGIVRPLRKASERFEVLNISRTGNRLLPASSPEGARPSLRRRAGTLVVEKWLGGVLGRMGIPTLALTPWIDNLCLRKR